MSCKVFFISDILLFVEEKWWIRSCSQETYSRFSGMKDRTGDRRAVNGCQIKFLAEKLAYVPNWPQSANRLQNLQDECMWANWWLSALKKVQRTNTAKHTWKHHSKKQRKRNKNATMSHSGIVGKPAWPPLEPSRPVLHAIAAYQLSKRWFWSKSSPINPKFRGDLPFQKKLRWFRSKSIISNQSQILLRRF